MQRNIILKDKRAGFDSLLTDQQSLLFKFCDQLLITGFVFEDSTANEIEEGGEIIKNFFDQENQVLIKFVSRESLNEFLKYISRFEWTKEVLEKKLSQRIKKSFNQLAKGKHHHYNILYNITHGLRQPKGHPLTDFLLYIESYYILVLGGAKNNWESGEEQNLKKKYYDIDDLVHLRKQIRKRLEGRVLVKNFLSHIAKSRGETDENSMTKIEKSYETLPANVMTEMEEANQKIFSDKFKDLKNYDSNISERNNEKFKKIEDIEFDVEDPFSFKKSETDDSDVVFGIKIISVSAMEKFVLQYPESALKFLMRQNIDGKPLSSDILIVHAGWEERGLSRSVLKNYVLKLMQWSDFPDLTFQDIYLQIRNRIFEVVRI